MDTRTDGQTGKRTEDELYLKNENIPHILREFHDVLVQNKVN